MILIKKHLCLIHVSEHKMWKADGFQKTNYLILLIIQSNIILHIEGLKITYQEHKNYYYYTYLQSLYTQNQENQ